jgi:hypothetical protein
LTAHRSSCNEICQMRLNYLTLARPLAQLPRAVSGPPKVAGDRNGTRYLASRSPSHRAG